MEEVIESRIGAADEIDQSHFGGAGNFRVSPEPSDLCIAFFSGPHASNLPIGDYRKVLMVVTGFGIAAQLPFLKELIQGGSHTQHSYGVATIGSRCASQTSWLLKVFDVGRR